MPDKLDEFHQHEVLDRLHIILSNLDDHLFNHPWVKANPKVAQLIQGAEEKLQAAYQETGGG